ncbi:MAG: protein translocase subunit SecD, partial [Planctomycetota bacterium]
GVREVVIRPYGENQVEIIIPDVSDAEKEVLRKKIVDAGLLKFRIVANQSRNPYEWDAAVASQRSTDPVIRNARFVKGADGSVIGEWILLGREDKPEGMELAPGQVMPLRFDDDQIAGWLTRELSTNNVEAFCLIDETFDIEGRHLRMVAPDIDQNGQPSIAFQMSSEGSVLFGGLTSSNLPTSTGIRAQLAIVMDDKMLSAPGIRSTITNNGVIEGRFTRKEVDYMVNILRAGKLPAVLKDEAISDNAISPLLGEDTIRKGKLAITASLLAVLIFMVFYYRFSGIVACLALITNLVLIVGSMILLQAAFTLPGLAGLVLTVGMSVDANVLIFERIREEMKKGATLRMAIRNGFSRATSTIVDANLTTLITAVVLYIVGTETIKGFAITLILGILISMYTAIFCSRVIFDIAERKGWIKSLSMTQVVGETNIDFVGLGRMAAVVSAICVLLGLGAVALRGSDILDIDFTGGTSIQVMLNEPMPVGDVRDRLKNAQIADNISVTEVKPDGQAANTVYKIDTSIGKQKELEEAMKSTFKDGDTSLLATHKMEFSAPVDLSASGSTEPQPRRSLDGMLLAYASPQDEDAAIATDATPAVTEPETESIESTPAAPSSDTGSIGGSETDPAVPSTGLVFNSKSTLTFDEKNAAQSVTDYIEDAAKLLGVATPRVALQAEGWDGVSQDGFAEWNVKLTCSPADATKLLSKVQEGINNSPAFLSSSKIGSKVAGDMTTAAMSAIIVSLLGIVGYIWVRFQHVGFGLAAVLALVHDVAITLGAVALSAWLASVFGFLLIDKFKISLPMVAAFLTIIGYSLNDTIVVFDRIREVKGKSPDLTVDMVNTSINQTLSRTLLTSVTTFIVVIILYMFGGQGIHGFAFALLIGVLVGTYSSI